MYCITFNPTTNQVSNPHLQFTSSASLCLDQLRNSYQVGYDGSLRIIYASGLDSHYQTEPHVLAGTANPTVAKRNMTLPGENGQNLVEWRFRKEQAQGKVNVFGRKLRVSQRQRAVMAGYSSASFRGLSTRAGLRHLLVLKGTPYLRA